MVKFKIRKGKDKILRLNTVPSKIFKRKINQKSWLKVIHKPRIDAQFF